MSARKILILVGDQADGPPLTDLLEKLQATGHLVQIASPGKKAGHNIPTTTGDLTPSIDFDTLIADDFDALILPGSRSPEYLRVEPSSLQLVRFFFESTFRSSGRAPDYGRLDPRVLELIQKFTKTNKPIAAVGQTVGILDAARDQPESATAPNIVTAPSGANPADWLGKFLKLLEDPKT